MTTISFIICSHRAPASLDNAIGSILAQGMLSSAELVVVNNGFPPERERELHALLDNRISFSLACEPVPGLGFARRKGFATANGDYFVLLDDDNTLAPGFIEGLLDVLEQIPGLGGVCPLVEPHWETQPPEWLQDFGRFCLSYNAAGRFRPQFEKRYWPPHEAKACLRPPGGGMVISRQVAAHYLEMVQDPDRIALARQPDSLVGCEDEDIFSGVTELGLGVAFSEHLKVYHHIPRVRTTPGYLIRLNYQMLRSYGVLHAMKNGSRSWGRFGSALTEFARNLSSHAITLARGEEPPQRFFLEIIRAAGFFVGRIS